jgi:hypothetical protein
MATVTYASMRNQAAEYAGIPSASLSTVDSGLLDGYLAARIREVWNSAPWPSLRHNTEFTPSARIIDKTAGSHEIGEVRWLTEGNRRDGSQWREIKFWDRGATLELDEDVASVWIDYLEECPATGFSGLTYDTRMAPSIILKAAASLCRAKGLPDAGNQFSGLADAALRREVVLVQRAAEH